MYEATCKLPFYCGKREKLTCPCFAKASQDGSREKYNRYTGFRNSEVCRILLKLIRGDT
jgi:hypothetical protein